MKGDFSRLALDPDTYSRVLMQQGRVMVDSDWNDQVAMVASSHRSLAADLVGPHGGPAGSLGFALASVTTSGKDDLTIGPGAYYVDGLRCVNRGPVGSNDPFRYLSQPYRAAGGMGAVPGRPYLAYLDVWERHVTAMDDDAIREVALGGPDTTTRAEIVWQVRVQPLVGDTWKPFVGATCRNFPLEDLCRALGGNRPRLKVRARQPDDVADDPCLSAPEARYRGQENQLYRVEIHSVEGDDVTFVWSRENGSVVAQWLATEGDDLRVASVRDKARGFEGGDWVELTDDGIELGNQAGVLVRLAQVDRDRLTMDPTTATGPIRTPAGLTNARVRRWDQRQRGATPLESGAVKVRTGAGPGDWIDLEDGIQVQFQPSPAGTADVYRVGDYWVAPARVASGDVIWPQDTAGHALAVPPHGVEHHFAPLAIVSGGGTGAAGGVKFADMRRRFAALAECVPT